ncbi:MAG: hypothetical protein FJ104_00080 [Deltaproteobacteria bacterium]|nr:hypothetical protein [Deltaproteobacteria bacterium]
MRPRFTTLLAAAILVTLMLAVAARVAPSPAGAAPLNLKFPALAGSQWVAAAGYNTATHLGVDP